MKGGKGKGKGKAAAPYETVVADNSAAQFRASATLAAVYTNCRETGHSNGRSPLCKETKKYKKRKAELDEMQAERERKRKSKSKKSKKD